MLDASHREVIELAYFGGLSQREIPSRTGIPLGTVKSRTTRAFKRLRGELAPGITLQERVRWSARGSGEANHSYNRVSWKATRKERISKA
jgi:hypothetical protein